MDRVRIVLRCVCVCVSTRERIGIVNMCVEELWASGKSYSCPLAFCGHMGHIEGLLASTQGLKGFPISDQAAGCSSSCACH